MGARTKAWWETRLLVLLAGAVRHKKIVFVGKDANMDRRFQGWSYVDDLLPQLVTAHPQYARSLESAWAAARHLGTGRAARCARSGGRHGTCACRKSNPEDGRDEP